MPRLQVTAGSSFDTLQPVNVNRDEDPLEVSNELFQGKLTVRIKDFKGADGQVIPDTTSGYFAEHSGLTWSIQIAGRFLEDAQLDDVVFGNVFDKVSLHCAGVFAWPYLLPLLPIKANLPYGTALALRFINFIDPALEHDIYADKPWAWSPLISTMNRMAISKSNEARWQSSQAAEDVLPLFKENASEMQYLKDNSDARRKYFADQAHRSLLLPKDMSFETDFCNGFIDFNELSVVLTNRLRFSLAQYWDGQPVRYICRSRTDASKVYFCIDFTLLEGLDGVSAKGAADKPKEAEQEISTDVD